MTHLVQLLASGIQLGLDVVRHVAAGGVKVRAESRTAISSAASKTPAANARAAAPPKFLERKRLESSAPKPRGKQCTEKMGGAGITGRTRPTKVKKQASAAKRKRDDVDVEKLEAAVAALVGHLHAYYMHCRADRM